MDNNYLVERNGHIIHLNDEVIIENKNKRFLATFIQMDDSDNAILKMNESGKHIKINRVQAQQYLKLNESNQTKNDLTLVDSKMFFGEIANDIISEETSSLKPIVDIDDISKYGINITENFNNSGRRIADIKKLESILYNAKIIAEKYNLDLHRLITEGKDVLGVVGYGIETSSEYEIEEYANEDGIETDSEFWSKINNDISIIERNVLKYLNKTDSARDEGHNSNDELVGTLYISNNKTLEMVEDSIDDEPRMTSKGDFPLDDSELYKGVSDVGGLIEVSLNFYNLELEK